LLFAERSPAFGALSMALTEPSLLIDLLPVLELLSLVRDEILFSLLFCMELVVITIYGPYGVLSFSKLFLILIGRRPWLKPVLTGSLLVYFLVKISRGGGTYISLMKASLSNFCCSSRISLVKTNLFSSFGSSFGLS
jgi:hypothetical protein